MTQDMSDASCVIPPTVCWISERESEAEKGMHAKNEPKMFPVPCRQFGLLSSRNFMRNMDIYHRQKFLVEINFVLQFLAENQRHGDGDGV